jgi:hypothetical protein
VHILHGNSQSISAVLKPARLENAQGHHHGNLQQGSCGRGLEG